MIEDVGSTVVTISVCTIVKNEEHNMRQFLTDVLRIGDEILIGDTGSTDGTVSIIKEFAAAHPNIIFFQYTTLEPFHFGKARNFLFDRATKDYILSLDADERPSEEFVTRIREFIQTERPIVASIIRKDLFLPHLIDTAERGRCIRRDSGIRYGTGASSQVHEQLDHHAEIKRFDGILLHDQGKNHYIVRPQRIMLQLELQIDRVPRSASFLGHVMRGVWYFFYRFKKIFITRKLYKDGILGFKYAFMRSVDAFLVEFFVGLKPSQKTLDELFDK